MKNRNTRIKKKAWHALQHKESYYSNNTEQAADIYADINRRLKKDGKHIIMISNKRYKSK